MIRYLDRDGNEITRDEWAKAFRPAYDEETGGPDEYRTVARDMEVLDAQGNEHGVSTVWLGLDHSLGGSHTPLFFETMVFCHHEPECGLNESQWRYSSELEALLGHADRVQEVREHAENGVER